VAGGLPLKYTLWAPFTKILTTSDDYDDVVFTHRNTGRVVGRSVNGNSFPRLV